MRSWKDGLIGGLLTVLILTGAALLPYTFYTADPASPAPSAEEHKEEAAVSPEPVYGTLTRSERAELYGLVHHDLLTPVMLDPEAVDKETVDACMERVEQIWERVNLDKASEPTVDTEGINYFSAADEQGHAIRYLEFYVGWNGDWKNWFRVRVDLDTCEVYWLYVSSLCQQNHDRYMENTFQLVEDDLQLCADITGWTPNSLSYDTKKDLRVLLDTQSGQAAYDVSVQRYFDDSPSILFDFEMVLQY